MVVDMIIIELLDKIKEASSICLIVSRYLLQIILQFDLLLTELQVLVIIIHDVGKITE